MKLMKKLYSFLVAIVIVLFAALPAHTSTNVIASEVVDTNACSCTGYDENNTGNPDVIIDADDDVVVYSEGTSTLPSAVDNSELRYFPVIGDQGGKGACVFFSVVYYQFTYEKNRLNNTYARTADELPIEQNVASPDHLRNLVFYGNNTTGYERYSCAKLLKLYGSASLADIPYNEMESTAFPSKDAMRNALNTRVSNIIEYTIDTSTLANRITSPSSERLLGIKGALNEGHVLAVDMYASDEGWSRKTIENSNERIIYRCSSPTGGTNHALTIVGYDDTIWCDINEDGVAQDAEYGAFKVANSWGDSWENDGFIWVAYDALNKYSAVEGWTQPSTNRVGAFECRGKNSFICIEVLNYSPKFLLEITTNTSWFTRGLYLIRYNGADDSSLETAIVQEGGVVLKDGEIGNVEYTMLLDYDFMCEPFGEYYTGYTWGFQSTKSQANEVTAASIVDSLGNTVRQFDISLSDPQNGVYYGLEEINLIRGDVNYDGVLSQSDVNSILRYTIGTETYSNTQYVIADMNGNGTIETADARVLNSLINSNSANEVSFEELYASVCS